jgi:hypothetical protein
LFANNHDVSRTATAQAVLLGLIELAHDAYAAQTEDTLSSDSLNAHIGQSDASGVTISY